MATPAQIQANRRNALQSTGPRSDEGKAVSRFNALKTGIQAKSQVIPGEDPAEFAQLAADYHTQFQPATPLERFLVDTLANADWQLRRFRTVEARLWEQSLAPEDPDLGQAYDTHLQTFVRLHRRIESIERSYFRALQQLQRTQQTVDPPTAPELASFSRIPSNEFPRAEAPSPDSFTAANATPGAPSGSSGVTLPGNSH